jgi:hypothetical protein
MDEKTRRIYVKCTLIVPVDVPDDPEYDAHFDIEENHCPGTGRVGGAINEVMAQAVAEHWCWACQFDGTNEIVDGS